MTNVTIIGAGNIGTVIAQLAHKGGAEVQVLARDGEKAAAANPTGTSGVLGHAPITGEIVVLALPYPAAQDVASAHQEQLAGKVVVDVSNPLDFATFDGLVVPPDSSAAAELAAALPGSRVVKAFNTNFGATLATGSAGTQPVTVLVAGDDNDAKAAVIGLVEAAGLHGVDAGALKRARELESIGLLQLTLGAAETITWTGGFTLNR